MAGASSACLPVTLAMAATASRVARRATIVGMLTRGIRDFVSRDWRAARDAKDAYWGQRVARLGAFEGLRIAEELRRQALLLDPAWPRSADRRDDLRSHVRLAELFRRADSARRA